MSLLAPCMAINLLHLALLTTTSVLVLGRGR